MSKYIKVIHQNTFCEFCKQEFLALRKGAKWCSRICRDRHNSKIGKMLEFRRASVENTILHVMWGARSRAKRRKMECSISDEYILEILKKQEGKCAMTGILLEASKPDSYKDRKPFVASIDRIDSSKGYIEGNVQIVCTIFNCCKNCYKIEDVTNMCKEYIKYNNICI